MTQIDFFRTPRPFKITSCCLGYGKNKGVVPLYCEDLFIRMKELQKECPENSYQVPIQIQVKKYSKSSLLRVT